MVYRVLRLRAAWLMCAIVLLSACAQMDLQPRTFNQRLAVGYAVVTVVRDMTADLLMADKISTADALNMQAQADAARAGLEVARWIHVTDENAAAARLDATLQTLQALQAYLTLRQGETK